MSLSQTQIIRSLGEALAWFEKELSWGTPIAELRHLTGRIGELYVAMVTRGQMALSVNQVGYDVVSAEGEKISVKTFTSSNHITFNLNTLSHVNRVIVLQIILDESEPSIRELLDCTTAELLARLSGGNKLSTAHLILPDAERKVRLADLKVVSSATWADYTVVQLENGTIQVRVGPDLLAQAKPALREIAKSIGVDILNTMGNTKNTRSLGSDIIRAIGQQSNGFLETEEDLSPPSLGS